MCHFDLIYIAQQAQQAARARVPKCHCHKARVVVSPPLAEFGGRASFHRLLSRLHVDAFRRRRPNQPPARRKLTSALVECAPRRDELIFDYGALKERPPSERHETSVSAKGAPASRQPPAPSGTTRASTRPNIRQVSPAAGARVTQAGRRLPVEAAASGAAGNPSRRHFTFTLLAPVSSAHASSVYGATFSSSLSLA